MVHTISPQASAEEASFPHLVLLSIAILSVVAPVVAASPQWHRCCKRHQLLSLCIVMAPELAVLM
jgi:hypothetical protein